MLQIARIERTSARCCLRKMRPPWVVTPGQLIAIPPGRPHAYGAGEHAWSIYWCHAAGAAAETFRGLLGGAPVLEIADYPRLVALFEEMAGELTQGYGFHHLLPASHYRRGKIRPRAVRT